MPWGGTISQSHIPYCGQPPAPGSVAWNLDPLLIVILGALAAAHLWAVRGDRQARLRTGAGWLIAALALISPLCNLSVALFSARVAQHIVLILCAAPLIAASLRFPWRDRMMLPPVLAFAVALWIWHLPAPYDATFRSDAIYWLMQVTLGASAVWIWHFILRDDGQGAARRILGALVTAIQMTLLGALLTLAPKPLFAPHMDTTRAFGLSQMTDQQLGGLIMWVPGGLLFTVLVLIACYRFSVALDRGPIPGGR